MCVTAAIAAVAGSALGAVSKIGSAQANKKSAIWKAKMEQKQIEEQRRTAQIQAMDQENQRTDEYEKARASSLAAIGAAGIGEHLSFIQGMDPAAREALLKDARNIRLNLAQTESTLTDQVGVAEASKAIAKTNAKYATIGAVADFVQTVGQAASGMAKTSTPKPASSGGATSVVK